MIIARLKYEGTLWGIIQKGLPITEHYFNKNHNVSFTRKSKLQSRTSIFLNGNIKEKKSNMEELH